jgi:hypothetical protein
MNRDQPTQGTFTEASTETFDKALHLLILDSNLLRLAS